MIEIAVHEHDTGAAVFLAGEFDLHGLGPFAEKIEGVLARRPASVEVDAGALRFIDSPG
jgi:anti-anti-sigma regulatory factor